MPDATALLAGTAWSPWSADVVEAEGPDATAFLQGQVSQDLAALPVGATALTFVLEPQGRLVALARAHRADEHRWLLVVDAGAGAALLTRLARYRLRTKVDLRIEAGVAVAAVRSASVSVPEGALASPFAALPGWDLLGATAVPGLAEAPAAALDALRVAALVPAAADLDERAIPAETGLVDVAASFTKGCYTGQELVARMDSRGGSGPRHLRRVEGVGEAPAPGAVVLLGDKEVGALTTVVATTNPAAWAGLGLLGRAVDLGAAVVVGDRPGAVAA